MLLHISAKPGKWIVTNLLIEQFYETWKPTPIFFVIFWTPKAAMRNHSFWPSYHPCMRNVKIIPGPVVATIKLLDTTHYKIIECLRMFFFFLFLDSITTCYYYHDVSFPSLLWARVDIETWSLRKVTSTTTSGRVPLSNLRNVLRHMTQQWLNNL